MRKTLLPRLGRTLRTQVRSVLPSSGESVDGGSHRALLTPEEFQEELVVLGLSGEEFPPQVYLEALEPHLEIEILLRPAESVAETLPRLMARDGKVALVKYHEGHRTAVVLVPGNLPPLARVLATHHELGHLAAGDMPTPGRLASHPPLPHGPGCDPPTKPCPADCPREQEVELRAYYATVAGALGPSSPYAGRMYDVL